MATRTDTHEVVDEVVTAAPVIARDEVESSDSAVDPLRDYIFPIPNFAKARVGPKKRLLPHIVAHRGFKAKFPENSLLAFREAVKAGATALETDVRLTKDEVVVLSHDPDLKRFGHDKMIVDCTWDEIKDARTSVSPHVPMLRLQDLLLHLLQPEFKGIWVLLDTKSNEEPEPLVRLTKSAIDSVRAPSDQPWNQRIVLGLWASWQLPMAATILPGFPALHIAFHLPYAKRHFDDPSLGVLMLIQTLLCLGGSGFIQDRLTKPGPTMAWTVNERDKAEWCARHGLDGIVTDDPEFVSQVFDQLEWARQPVVPISLRSYYDIIKIYIWVNYYFEWFTKKLKLEDYAYRKGLIEKKKKDKTQ